MTSIGVGLLIFLGTWQVYRLQWKENLILTFHNRMAQPVRNVHTITSTSNADIEFMPVEATGTFLKNFKLKLQGRSHKGQIGYHYIMAFLQTDGRIVLVDRGWIPLAETSVAPDIFLPITLKGYIRPKSDHNFMTPSNRYDRGEIYRLDPLEIAQKFNLTKIAPFYIVETGSSIKGVYPMPAQPVLHLRNAHLQYAIIWYTLALGLIVIYVLFQRQGIKTVVKR